MPTPSSGTTATPGRPATMPASSSRCRWPRSPPRRPRPAARSAPAPRLNTIGAEGGFSTHICDVEVDRDTGRVRVMRYTAFQDVGRAIHPDYVEGQMQGGVAQGIGWALNEEYIYNKHGQLDNAGFLDYRMPVASDLPMLDAVIIEIPNPKHPQGVRGVGEVPLVPGMAAVANAVHNAIGLRFDQPADVAAQGAGGARAGAVGESSRLTLALNQPARCAGKKNRENVHEAGHETAPGADRIGRGRRPAGRGRNAGAKRPLQGVAGPGRAGEGRQAAAGRATPAGEAAGGAGGREGRRVWRRVAPGVPRAGRCQQLHPRRL